MRIEGFGHGSFWGLPGSSPFASGAGTTGPSLVTPIASSPPAVRALEVPQTFAEEIVHRIQTSVPHTPEGGEKDATSLTASLARTADFLGDEYGDQAARAFMGIVSRRVHHGAGEDDLGRAMLDAVSFMDRAYGAQAGDKLLDHLNADLNSEVNAYFDNGKNEVLFALSPQDPTLGRILDDAADALAERFGTADADAAVDLIRQSLAEAPNRSGLRKGLRAAQGYLLDRYGPRAEVSLPGLSAMTGSADALEASAATPGAKAAKAYVGNQADLTGILVDVAA